VTVKGPSGAAKPQYFEDPAVDALYQMVLILGEELAGAREQIHALTQLLDDDDLVHKMDAFEPGSEFVNERSAFVDRLLRPLQELVDKEKSA
jgi:hypothetical protein